MPHARGTSRKTLSRNIRELHTGKNYARTARKSGKRAANKQAIAIAHAQRRKSKRGARK